ncbi:hypothetical protein A3A71_03575 [Candidatus Berkelbacteria bacterium RIFCSPLOWO2_01_FULL_50_28]|uniref:Probable DNA 3'-5' helicase RecG n=1 Tax=Candidatus Berkelbacteria bacterium RIFCSPLOWO2_01_FULL_50_28 TaxID=1797471 RepID=A0A1F5ED48_9BACT|nr:MAG: hypothetical protein A2807_03140 [Candidatus Berkelbacteria bacterium RIFCSPHIGHO2_01_FULL_50_36]OGD65134.1 MAG: hypothetical protein A3A71_03575 [Candidatus Berkelbacteria bacterium RIFCSPLOWO2_01_FULL_50_28]
MTSKVSLVTRIGEVTGVGPTVRAKLAHIGVRTVGDLFELLPRRSEDHSTVTPISQLLNGEETVIGGIITRISSRLSKRGVFMIEAVISDESRNITAVWFNQRYLLGQLKVGTSVFLFGTKRPSRGGGMFVVKKIVTELKTESIYPSTEGLAQGTIRRLLRNLEPELAAVANVIPSWALTEHDLPDRARALGGCHFDGTPLKIESARRLLGLEELVLLCLQAQTAKRERMKIRSSEIQLDEERLQQTVAALPFKLTDGQRRASWEILQDLTRGYPMNRLLYGEVGSGKTAVAAIVAATVAASNRQIAWLNPTLTLAHQQAEVLQRFCQPLGLKIALITSLKKDSPKEADIIVGTHALLNAATNFRSIGLVIVDEQHRFGALQRQKILGHFPDAHLLMLSATPIPRSLSQTIFGHLDLTLLKEKPRHQKPVETKICAEGDRTAVEREIKLRLERGESGYVICPLIEEGSNNSGTLWEMERKTIAGEEKRWREVFATHRLAVLHGRLKGAEKERIGREFRQGKVDILLATTVVEVGIDNPAATWMLIENAERFGLSTLHQLRGRVGRGEKASICFLFSNDQNDLATQRLRAVAENNDGLTLAEKDLQLRGPGELVGLEQSGLPPLRYGSFNNHFDLKIAVEIARRVADEGVAHYPEIKRKLAKFDEPITA